MVQKYSEHLRRPSNDDTGNIIRAFTPTPKYGFSAHSRWTLHFLQIGGQKVGGIKKVR